MPVNQPSIVSRLGKCTEDLRAVALELGATAHGSQLMACVAIVNTIRIQLGLDEVAEAPAVDLRLKHALVGGER